MSIKTRLLGSVDAFLQAIEHKSVSEFNSDFALLLTDIQVASADGNLSLEEQQLGSKVSEAIEALASNMEQLDQSEEASSVAFGAQVDARLEQDDCSGSSPPPPPFDPITSPPFLPFPDLPSFSLSYSLLLATPLPLHRPLRSLSHSSLSTDSTHPSRSLPLPRLGLRQRLRLGRLAKEQQQQQEGWTREPEKLQTSTRLVPARESSSFLLLDEKELPFVLR